MLFATHYHELNYLAKDYPGIANRHVRIKEVDGRMVFLRTLAEGGTSHSFGIEVARMAGMPPSMVLLAHSLLSALEQAADREKSAKSSDSSGLQLSFIQWEDPKAQTW